MTGGTTRTIDQEAARASCEDRRRPMPSCSGRLGAHGTQFPARHQSATAATPLARGQLRIVRRVNGDRAHDREWLDAIELEDDLIFVVATGDAVTRATFTAELARRLCAAHLDVDVVDRALRRSVGEGRRRAVSAVIAALADTQLRAGISVVVDAELDAELENELNRVQRSHPDTPVVRVQALEGQSLQPDRLVDEVIDRANRRRR